MIHISARCVINDVTTLRNEHHIVLNNTAACAGAYFCHVMALACFFNALTLPLLILQLL
jgi:hypothetical protein